MESEKRESVDSIERFLERAAELGQRPPEYHAHPPEEILRAYLLGSLPRGARRTPEMLSAMARGELKDWRQAEVGVHVKTCARCARRVTEMRAEPLERQPSPLERFGPWIRRSLRSWAPMPAPTPARVWIWATSLVVVLGIGIIVGSLFQPISPLRPQPPGITKAQIDEALGRVRSEAVPFRPLDLLRVSQLFQQAGIDLGRLDLERPPFEYKTKAGETLREIARKHYGDERYWVLIYLLNYEYDELQKVLQKALEVKKDPSRAELPEGLVLVLVERKR